MDHSINGPDKLANKVVAWLWYGGTDALKQGEPVCFNTDYGTATDADARRGNHCERPSSSNNGAFAGVAARAYSAKSGGQFIEVYGPGSKSVPVALGVDTVLNTGLLTFCTGAAGRFQTGKFLGRGSAIPRQTVTAVLEESRTGAWSLATNGITLTVVSTTGLSAGDAVNLLGGENDGTGALVPGKYVIASITSATVLVLTATAVDVTPGGAITCTGYAYTGNPTAICDLLEGDESGGVEFISPPNAGGDSLAHMVGGVTYVCGGVTLAADSECEFAQGTRVGQRKAFALLGTLTTSDFVVDLVTAGVQLNRTGTTAVELALAEVNAFDAAGDQAYFEFRGARWFLTDKAGGATAA